MPDTQLLIERRWNSVARNVQQAREIARNVVLRFAASDCADLIELAIGEACANAIEHGSPAGECSEFVLRCFVQPEQPALVFEVEDEGQEFSLSHLPLGHAPDLYAEGGRGLFLISQIMDEVALQSTPHGLNIRMIKHVATGHREMRPHDAP